LAFISSLAAALIVVGGGLALLAIDVSGERGSGALLALGGAVATAAVMLLVFVREGAFGDGIRRHAAIGVAIIGAIPPAALAFAAFRFSGVPIATGTPLIDLSAFTIGLFFALGTVSILALGHRRSQEGAALPMVHMQQIRSAQQQLRSAYEASQQRPAAEQSTAPSRRQQPPRQAFEGTRELMNADEDDIRVRHV
jgi:hypothetical protein